MRILVVDDSELIREKIKITLLLKNHIVDLANNGNEGLKRLMDNKYNLIITDLVMPDMEGIEFILQSKKKYPNIKIIAMSGANPVYLNTAIEMGADYKIQKPFSDEQLIAAIKNLMKDIKVHY